MIVIELLGGLGLFLLGMMVMTDGLKTLAGSVMRRGLMEFTRTPISGVWTGALATAVLQSSSATTVATVGFVSAGLIPFTAALGIILGANIGTTMTGWLVVRTIIMERSNGRGLNQLWQRREEGEEEEE